MRSELKKSISDSPFVYKMKIVPIIVLIIQAVSSNDCCTEESIIIQIKNYEGPIYVQAPQPCDEKTLHHLTPKIRCDCDCNCVSKPASSCVPINTASQCTSGLYNVPYSSYQDTSVNTACTPGLYNAPYSLYQDSVNTAQCTSGLYNVPYSLYQDSVNTAQCTPGLYNVPYSLYQDTSVNTACTPGLYSYNVPSMYQDNCCPVVQLTTQCGQDSCMCGKCGRTYSSY